MVEILFCCEAFVVCLKPCGPDSEHELPQMLIRQLGGEIYPVHRLDRNVGGVMVYARTAASAAALSQAVQEGTMVKEYVALVHGLPPEKGDWTDLLFKDSRANKVFVVDKSRSGVKSAHLRFTRLAQCDPAPVRVRLYTGRSHQIRVQFASRGFPLVGDHKYGARDSEKVPRLYSCCLSFPFGRQKHRFEALPDWPELLKSEENADISQWS